MYAEQFYRSRQADWQKLTRLLERSRNDIRQLSPEEVRDLIRLYRAVTSDLALAQRDFPHHQVTTYLNQLVAQAHAVIYRSEPLALDRIRHFITVGFPGVYRETLRFTFAAALFFFLPALLASLSTAWRPAAARWLLPSATQHVIRDLEQRELWTDIPIHERPYTSSFIMRNNIQVAFLAFGGGMLAGIVTIWVLINNGLILGGVAGLAAHYGVGRELWTFIIGHSAIELSVICIAGGAGLMLGWAIIQPGLLSRRDALTLAAHKAIRLVIGCIPLLVLAGLIEGFISPAETIPWWVKWGVGLGSGVLLHSYLLLAGRHSNMRPLSSR